MWAKRLQASCCPPAQRWVGSCLPHNSMLPNSMRTANIKSAAHAGAVLLGASLLLSALAAPPHHSARPSAAGLTGNPPSLSLTIDPAQAKVHWTLPSSLHTVHGTFAMTHGTLSFDVNSGKASGEIVVNAKSGQSGNDS